jgi:dTDP-4-amino-4,6-dideoxygalactose transaminase
VSEPDIPAGRPLLPTADKIARYLSRLDRSCRYANHGELVGTLEARLTALFGPPAAHTVSAASGTAALTGAILAAAGRATAARPLCLCPAHTFAATALAAEQCGYRVHFVDVDDRSWALNGETVTRHALLDRTGIVVVTAPYGRRFSQAAWARFRDRTGVPVVIDAAASVEALADDAEDLLGTVPGAACMRPRPSG